MLSGCVGYRGTQYVVAPKGVTLHLHAITVGDYSLPLVFGTHAENQSKLSSKSCNGQIQTQLFKLYMHQCPGFATPHNDEEVEELRKPLWTVYIVNSSIQPKISLIQSFHSPYNMDYVNKLV